MLCVKTLKIFFNSRFNFFSCNNRGCCIVETEREREKRAVIKEIWIFTEIKFILFHRGALFPFSLNLFIYYKYNFFFTKVKTVAEHKSKYPVAHISLPCAAVTHNAQTLESKLIYHKGPLPIQFWDKQFYAPVIVDVHKYHLEGMSVFSQSYSHNDVEHLQKPHMVMGGEAEHMQRSAELVYGWMVYTEHVLRPQQFHVTSAMQQPKSTISTPLLWILKICATKRILSLIWNYMQHVHSEFAREQRIVLYKSNE